jgi:hypothetical protein
VLEPAAAFREIDLGDFLVDILRLVFDGVDILHLVFDGLERGSFTREAPMVDGKVGLFECSRAKGLASSWVSGMRSSSSFCWIVSSGLNRAMLAIILTTQLVRPTGVF